MAPDLCSAASSWSPQYHRRMCWFTAWTVALLLLVQSISSVHTSGNICFLKPYFTSAIIDAHLENPNRYKLSIDVDLDYTRNFKLDNIFIDFNFTALSIDVQFNNLKVTQQSDTGVVRMARDRLKNQTYADVKNEYYKSVSRILAVNPKASALMLGQHCSPLAIKDAFLFEPTSPTEDDYNFIYYKDSTRCVSHKQTHFKFDYRDRGVSAASFHNKVAIEFFPTFATFKVFKEGPYGQSVHSALNESGYLQVTRLYTDLFASVCGNVSGSLELTSSTSDDVASSGAFQTFFKHNEVFMGVKPVINFLYSDGVHAVPYQELYSWQKDSGSVHRLTQGRVESLPWVFNAPTFSLEAVSFSDDPTPSGHAFYYNNQPGSCRHQYLKYFQPGTGAPLAPAPVCHPTVPDDITHWSSCRKIVAVYGFTYGLYEYSADLLSDYTHLQLFDENLLDHPISAVHAEGDEFWFFTKPYTVQVMKASSKDCTKLNLVRKHTIHYRQLFDPEIKQVMLEGRYYDGQKWVPDWDFVPSMSIESPQVWTYVGAGLALTAIFLVLLLIYILRRSEKHRGASVFSLNRNSSVIHKSIPLADKNNRQTVASTMPLFSQHETLNRSTSSTTSGLRKSVSPGKRRKYLEHSPTKPKRTKSKSPRRPHSRSPSEL